jgi:hypothetical protein
MIHRDSKEYFQQCDVCQWVGKPNNKGRDATTIVSDTSGI